MCTNAFSEGATKYDRGYKDRKTRYKEKQEQSQVLSFRGFLGKLYLFFPLLCRRVGGLFPTNVCLSLWSSLPPPPSISPPLSKNSSLVAFAGKRGRRRKKERKERRTESFADSTMSKKTILPWSNVVLTIAFPHVS